MVMVVSWLYPVLVCGKWERKNGGLHAHGRMAKMWQWHAFPLPSIDRKLFILCPTAKKPKKYNL